MPDDVFTLEILFSLHLRLHKLIYSADKFVNDTSIVVIYSVSGAKTKLIDDI